MLYEPSTRRQESNPNMPLTDPSLPQPGLAAGTRMPFDQLKRREFIGEMG